MNLLFTVCGRAGSKGVKNKNIRDFSGYPLFLYTLSAIDLFIKENQVDGLIIHTCVSTDSPDLLGAVSKQNVVPVYPLKRSPKLCGDFVGKVSVIKDCLINSNEYYGVKHDIVVDLDLTSPIRGITDITNAIDTAIAHNEHDIVFSVTNARRSPYFDLVQLTEGEGYKPVIKSKFTARQQVPLVYDMNASIYVYKSSFLERLNSDLLFEGNCGITIMEDTGILEIDSEQDFALMEYLSKYFLVHNPEFADIVKNIPNLSKFIAVNG